MHKNFIRTLFFALILLTSLTTACQSLPGLNLFSAAQESNQNAPRSNFVAAQEVLLTSVDQPVLIESYHIAATKIVTVEVSINHQPPRAEATAGQANVFPPDLATLQVLERGRPAQAALQSLLAAQSDQSSGETANPYAQNSPSPACQELLRSGGPAQTNVFTPDISSSRWTVCHIWVGRVPGTYDLSVAAVDETGLRGDPVTQRIEVR